MTGAVVIVVLHHYPVANASERLWQCGADFGDDATRFVALDVKLIFGSGG